MNIREYALRQKRFLRHAVYFAARYVGIKHSREVSPLVGYSFDAIHQHINIHGAYEGAELEVLGLILPQLIPNRSLALDVGANIGNHSVRLFAPIFEKVIAYEPNPRIFDLLRLNAKTTENVHAKNYGLSDKVATVDFEVDVTNWGASRIVSSSGGAIETESIEVRPLDGEDLPSVDLIKLDIEGHELKFLLGAKGVLIKDKPVILFEENKVNEHGSSAVIEMLASLGYEFYLLQENFPLGESKALKLLRYALQDVFGLKIRVRKVRKFDRRAHSLIVAVHESQNTSGLGLA